MAPDSASSETRLVGDLELEQDLDFQRRSWRVQRIGWLLILGLLAGAVAGLSGSGPLADGRASTDGLTVDFPRFIRFRQPEDLEVRVDTGRRQVAIGLSNGWVEDVEIQSVIPKPVATRVRPDRTVYLFRTDPSGVVRFVFEPTQSGIKPATVHGPGGRRVDFTQFVFP